MFDHVGLNVRDYEASKRFYDGALAPFGYGVVMECRSECDQYGARRSLNIGKCVTLAVASSASTCSAVAAITRSARPIPGR